MAKCTDPTPTDALAALRSRAAGRDMSPGTILGDALALAARLVEERDALVDRIPFPWCLGCEAECRGVDEDGCCGSCGADVVPLVEHLQAENATLRAERDEAQQRAQAYAQAVTPSHLSHLDTPERAKGRVTSLRTEIEYLRADKQRAEAKLETLRAETAGLREALESATEFQQRAEGGGFPFDNGVGFKHGEALFVIRGEAYHKALAPFASESSDK